MTTGWRAPAAPTRRRPRDDAAAGTDRRPRTASPGGGALLGLQQSAGNRAVVGAVQRQAPSATLPRLLRTGTTGDDVRHAQERLNAHGATPPLATDASFGPLTRGAVVRYQRTHALDPDGVVGPLTSASLEGPTDVGGSSGQARTTPGALPPAAVLRYDTVAYTVTPPAPGTTRASLDAAVAAKQRATPPDLGPTVTVTGAPARSQAELFLWNVLVQLGSRARWGTEVDLVTAIGPAPTRPPGPAPMGRVTVRIDAQGNAVATLVAAGTVPAAPAFADRAAATAALLALGFARVRDGSAGWTLDELGKAHAGLSRVPAAERAAFAGVDLVRERTLASASGDPLAGRFSHRAQLAVGATTATRSASLELADLAFSADAVSFVGDATTSAPASSLTIVHEAGHAVETKALRDAQFETLQAQGVLNGRITAQNAAVAHFNTEMRTAFAAAGLYPAPQIEQARGFLRSVNAATTALRAMSSSNDPAASAGLERRAVAALAARDAARTALAARHAGHPALTDFATTLAAQDAWLVAARARAAANADVQASRRAEQAVTGAQGRSARLDAFVAHVQANRIPPLTAYAASNWPNHPEEFFAEAYSLWRNDRQYLQTNAPTLVAWFDAGSHLR
jgi:peptidoglycan hydrolase-like protein with peptidoglycan-binding domain